MSRLLGTLDELQEIIGVFAVIAIGVLALVRGPRPQRLAGAVLLADGFGLVLAGMVFDALPRLLAGDVKAGLVLVAYGLMTLRWPDRWIMAMTALQGLAVLLRLSRWADLSLPASVTGLVLNATGWGMLAILAAAVALSDDSRAARRRF